MGNWLIGCLVGFSPCPKGRLSAEEDDAVVVPLARPIPNGIADEILAPPYAPAPAPRSLKLQGQVFALEMPPTKRLPGVKARPMADPRSAKAKGDLWSPVSHRSEFYVLDLSLGNLWYPEAQPDSPQLSDPKPYTRKFEVYISPGVHKDDAPLLLYIDGMYVDKYSRFMRSFGAESCLRCWCCGKHKRSIDMIAQLKDRPIAAVVEQLVSEKKIPPVVLVIVWNCDMLEDPSGASVHTGHGTQRNLELTTVSPEYADLFDEEVLPFVENRCGVKISEDRDRRVLLGLSSGGCAAINMAWQRPKRWSRVVAYNPSMVNYQYPYNPATPLGMWDYHSGKKLIENGLCGTSADEKVDEELKMRVKMYTAEWDIGCEFDDDTHHNWLTGGYRTADALKRKGHTVSLTHCEQAVHVDPRVFCQTLPSALEWAFATTTGDAEETKSEHGA